MVPALAFASNLSLVPFDVAGAGNTYAYGINDFGWIVGNANGLFGDLGFVRAPNGAITTFAAPGATDTVATDVNGLGAIVGFYFAGGATYQSFVRDSSGTYVSFQYLGIYSTYARGINDTGEIVGNWSDPADNTVHGFVRDSSGNVTSLDCPGASSTVIQGINNFGWLTGNCYFGATTQAFTRDPAGNFSLFSLPGNGLAYDINNSGEVVGWLNQSGFLRDSFGGYSYYQVAGSAVTAGNGINDSGEIVGEYHTGPNLNSHGFYTASGSPTSSVPEPATLPLLALGLVAIRLSKRGKMVQLSR
ncbi:MAG: PEP-CTERM sorting domain-containing protein [Rudaea sp.]